MNFKFMLFACSSVLALNVHAQKFDVAACNKLIPQIKQQADSCIKIKDQSQRKQCFDKLGQSIPSGGCDQALNPIKQDYMAKEKQLYPTQASALGGNNGQQGNMGSQPGSMGQHNQQGMMSGQPGQISPGQPGQQMPQGGQPNQQGMKPGQPGQTSPGQPGQISPGQPGQQMPQGPAQK